MAQDGQDDEGSAETEVRDLLESIRQAFRDVPYPGDDGIVTVHFDKFGGECMECAEVRDTLLGKDWSTYFDRPFELFGYFAPREPAMGLGRGFIPLLQAEAVHYFLPLFLAALITDTSEADVMIYSIPTLFAPGAKTDAALRNKEDQWQWRHARCERLLAIMDAPQRLATAAALRFIFRDDFFGVERSAVDAVANLEAGDVLEGTTA